MAGIKATTPTSRINRIIKKGLRAVTHEEYRNFANMIEVMIRIIGAEWLTIPNLYSKPSDP